MSADELKLLPQWTCAGDDKKPRTITGELASVSDPRTWNTYENCKAADYPYVGFVLTAADPYAIIDLDYTVNEKFRARQQRILNEFDSYTELSCSGQGYHIIIRGSIPRGVRRDNVEVYSSLRYIICTDNNINDKKIEPRQDLLNVLFAEMAPVQSQARAVSEPQTQSDQQIIHRGMHAKNADKFLALCRGEIDGYASHSEADFALLSLLSFYSANDEQVIRLFKMSALGKRKKARRDAYLNDSLAKLRANVPAPIDVAALTQPPPAPAPPKKPAITFPPGIVGELAEYIYSSSIRPVREVGLVAALALFAGITGRSYNVSGTGLNQYLILLAGTGTGKEGAGTGIDTVITRMLKTLPSATRFIGPSGFASGQALLRTLDKTQSFVSVLGEFGITLQQICDSRANSAQTMLKRVLLDLYSKSGAGKIMHSNVYADSDKNTKQIVSPALTLLGESTPVSFFDMIEQEHIAEGLIPRFTFVAYTGKRPKRNKTAFFPPDELMINTLVDIATQATLLEQNTNVINVQMDNGAQALLDNFDEYADDQINNAHSEVETQLWNRAHLKALKMAGLIAVGVQYEAPIITRDIADWAIDFIKRDVSSIVEQFADGAIGSGESRQEAEIRDAIMAYHGLTPSTRRGYKVPLKLVNEGCLVPFVYLRRRLNKLKVFNQSRIGGTKAIAFMLDNMVTEGSLKLMPVHQAYTLYKTHSPIFLKGEDW